LSSSTPDAAQQFANQTGANVFGIGLSSSTNLANIVSDTDNLFILGNASELINLVAVIDQNFTETTIRQFFRKLSDGKYDYLL
jgi:hypothetical protein